MPLRNFFEGLGDISQAALGLLPHIGAIVNILFSLAMAGFGAYWFLQMFKASRRGEH